MPKEAAMTYKRPTVNALVALVAMTTMTSTGCGSTQSTEPSGTLVRPTARPLAVIEAPISTEPVLSTSTRAEHANSDVTTAFEWLMLRRIECGRHPRECVVDDLAVPGSPVHDALTEVMADRVRYGIVASDRGAHRFRIDKVVPVAIDEMELRVCHSDDVVLTMAVGPGRTSAIYDESWSSHWATWTMKSVDGAWRWSEELVERRVYEEELCEL